MKREDIAAIIKKERVIAIVRTKEQLQIPELIQDLVEGGIKVIEITSNTPRYLEEIAKAKKRYANFDIIIGAGTVTNVQIANAAIKAGAQFLVTPNTNTEVLALAHHNNIPVAMGALTPTEICLAAGYGADIIKLFPAGDLGISYFKSVKAPLDTITFFVVGGINLSNIEEWIAAGISGVGLGAALTKQDKNTSADSYRGNTIQKFVKIIKESQWKN
ncbi:2-dehydro-3-deoxyphosphogluconate aldolase / (4S)-4-hydroxy-2-oxoglutarate aldolase [Hyunsoonleella jejuensis]|uniref:2-dehydro-3-deoxyphosphogluconate aldolase / (4S)-4-hydroxy-2-oxoglutarate aldolase n=1 Tax=Hyunsoonleella jejuensis TaxID=419940 RepID=A0A1H9KNP7_9FLAO|nr:bifunctional 4-hydroxy-2-oxoglutarate aldolase/2-dehydro-3-deoxy-phosphogluconate aldolase [Hyunsoonleella jejuensis]SER00786.1 2-dehydro-3-deoxyphosphogluconate aldolase / (4S)-4-hydroxy-2-oxoglutarate aldolase [Hyunsoonleella jejuensis]